MELTRWRQLSALVGMMMFFSGQAFCDDCPDPLFSCESNRPGKFIRICATELQPGHKWTNIQYRYGAEDKDPEFSFPTELSSGTPLLFFSHVKKGADYRVSIRFENKGYTYRVFSTTGRDGAGVSVMDAKGKVISVTRCIERPYIFPSYLQRALACDLENPNGQAACGEHPYQLRP